MTAGASFRTCDFSDLVELFVVGILRSDEHEAFAGHLPECSNCRAGVDSLQPVVSSLAHWPGNEIAPSQSLWLRVAEQLGQPDPMAEPAADVPKLHTPPWSEPAPGIFCRILAADEERSRVSMLVRLEPGVSYPAHTHAGVEELHLLDGELWIDDHRLVPGDYNRAEPGTFDLHVWSQTGCTCVLVTSPADVLGKPA